MTEETPALFFEDFLEFVQAKKIQPKCEVCGQSAGWTCAGLPSSGEQLRPVLGMPFFQMNSDGTVKDIYMTGAAYVTTECNNCSRTRLFSYEKILAWKKSRLAPLIVGEAKSDN